MPKVMKRRADIMIKVLKPIVAKAATAGLALAMTASLTGCGLDEGNLRQEPEAEWNEAINLSGEISQVYQTRANDSGFADKDKIGIYIVDYDGSTAGALKSNGNRGDNVRFTFDEASWKWTPDHDIYWKDKQTHIDVYGTTPTPPASAMSMNMPSRSARIRTPSH